MQRRYVLAIDVGGSATRATVVDFEGNLLGFGSGGPSDGTIGSWDAASESIAAAVRQAIAEAGADAPQIDVVVAGSPGVTEDGDGGEPLQQLIAELVPQCDRVRVTSEMVIAFWGALSLPVGVVVSAGTGAASFGRNVTGEATQVGGWGPLLGDEGSAYDIARHALRAVARAADGRARPTLLTDLLLRTMSVNDPSELASKIYRQMLDRDQIARLAVCVARGAQQHDTTAVKILEGAARDLTIAVSAVLRQLRLTETRVSVSYSGSVFEAGRSIILPFKRSMREAMPNAVVEAPLLPPIGGAYRLGLQVLGVTMDEPIIHRFAKGLVNSGL